MLTELQENIQYELEVELRRRGYYLSGSSGVSEAVYYEHSDYPGTVRLAAHCNGNNEKCDVSLDDQKFPFADVLCDSLQKISVAADEIEAWGNARTECIECGALILKSDATPCTDSGWESELVCKECPE